MASIQFNLLPDAKATYISAQRNRKLVTTIALLVSGISIAIFVIVFFSVNVVQKKVLSDADKNVKNDTQKLKDIPSIGQILTVQNQLQTLSSLHQNKHAVSRIFTYMPQLTPAAAHISSLNLDLGASSLQVNGTADSQKTVNTFVDTLKYAEFKTSDTDQGNLAFSNVLLSSFSITPGQVSYAISANFNPVLFSNPQQKDPTIVVKNQVTTRSVLDDPNNALFNGQPKKNQGQ
jgi:Tfp pilus assembly protein PilN